MTDRYGGSAAADRLLVDNTVSTVNALKVLQEVTTGTVSAAHIENSNTTSGSRALVVKGGADLISARTLADTEVLKVDQSGNVTAAGSLSATGGILTDGSPFTAADAGYLAWNYDAGVVSSASTPTTNVVNLVRINIRQAISVTNVVIGVTTAGSGLTSGQNFAGLYSSAGTLIGTSADQTTAWGTAGVKSAALAGGPFAVAAGFVWVAIVSNTGTSTPNIFRSASGNAAAMNTGFAVATARWASNGTATTALAGTITPASNTLTGTGYWAALS